MKIAMFGHKRVPSREGGVEVVTQQLSVRLAARGHQVCLYNRGGRAAAECACESETGPGLEGVDIKTVPTVEKKGLAAVSSSFFAALAAAFGDADVVHICMAPEALKYIEELIQSFGDHYSVVRHERLAPLRYGGICTGYKDLRPDDALICFSRKSVLSTAALLEKNGFRASVIYGALPPEARRSEVSCGSASGSPGSRRAQRCRR